MYLRVEAKQLTQKKKITNKLANNEVRTLFRIVPLKSLHNLFHHCRIARLLSATSPSAHFGKASARRIRRARVWLKHVTIEDAVELVRTRNLQAVDENLDELKSEEVINTHSSSHLRKF
jgi:hypothetical protein